MGGYCLQGSVGSYMVITPQEAGEADLCLPSIGVDEQMHILVLERSPQPFNEDAVVPTLSYRPADLNRLSLQAGNEDG